MDLNDGKLDFFHCSEVMKDLGMIGGKSNTDVNEERILYVEMWKELEGDERRGISPSDLKSFLVAVLGMYEVSEESKNKKGE